jgi:hypothetical protein
MRDPAAQMKSLEIIMALDTHTEIAAYSAPKKDLYEVSEMPPLGYVPWWRPRRWTVRMFWFW